MNSIGGCLIRGSRRWSSGSILGGCPVVYDSEGCPSVQNIQRVV